MTAFHEVNVLPGATESWRAWEASPALELSFKIAGICLPIGCLIFFLNSRVPNGTRFQVTLMRRRRIWLATLKSSFAFLTHSRVVGFIQDLASFHDFPKETIPPAQPLGDFRRRPHE